MRPIKAWAVIYPESQEIVKYQDYEKEPNDVLMRICHTKKLANQIKLHLCKVIEVEIRPVKRRWLGNDGHKKGDKNGVYD